MGYIPSPPTGRPKLAPKGQIDNHTIKVTVNGKKLTGDEARRVIKETSGQIDVSFDKAMSRLDSQMKSLDKRMKSMFKESDDVFKRTFTTTSAQHDALYKRAKSTSTSGSAKKPRYPDPPPPPPNRVEKNIFVDIRKTVKDILPTPFMIYIAILASLIIGLSIMIFNKTTDPTPLPPIEQTTTTKSNQL